MKEPDHRLIEHLRWTAIGLGLKVLARVLMHAAKRDAWMGRAVATCDGVYRFENGPGNLHCFLVFQQGRVLAPREWRDKAHVTFTIYDFSAFGLRTRADNLLETVIGNKVGQSGNLYYLFQFGFIMSLLERYFTARKRQRKDAIVNL
jgi:hypothetical protein